MGGPGRAVRIRRSKQETRSTLSKGRAERRALRQRHLATTSGTLPAGGVLRLRWVRTMPSMMVMPMPGKSPSWTLCSRFLPGECCATVSYTHLTLPTILRV